MAPAGAAAARESCRLIWRALASRSGVSGRRARLQPDLVFQTTSTRRYQGAAALLTRALQPAKLQAGRQLAMWDLPGAAAASRAAPGQVKVPDRKELSSCLGKAGY